MRSEHLNGVEFHVKAASAIIMGLLSKTAEAIFAEAKTCDASLA
jgi:hypothetical protein